jgi:periplasmic divalent cation tolerance protein
MKTELITELILVYMTAPDAEVARRIGETLVAERLAACVNRIDGMEAFFEWQGALQSERECVLLAKTRAALFDRVAERVRALHPYDTPCVVALPLVAADAAFAEWVLAQTIAD